MTVTKLIEALQQLVLEGKATGDEEVSTEGCDCYGDVGSVSVERDGDDRHDGEQHRGAAVVLLERTRC